MTAVEMIVVVTGALFGFWVVSYLMDEMKRPERPPLAPAAVPTRWHDTLGVSEHASLEEITAAYQRKLDENHPDKVASLGPELRELAASRTRQIEAAYSEAMMLRSGTQ